MTLDSVQCFSEYVLIDFCPKTFVKNFQGGVVVDESRLIKRGSFVQRVFQSNFAWR